jgi:hypothetical protein
MFARMIAIASTLHLPRARCHAAGSAGSLVRRLEKVLRCARDEKRCVMPMLRDVSHEGGVKLRATAVHAPAREAREAREEWASMQAGPRFRAILARMRSFFRASHEAHEAHEESSPMSMASGSEAIPPEEGFF